MNTAETAVRGYLEALTLKEQADKAHDEAREIMLEVLAEQGLSEVEMGEVTVKLSPTERRSFDLDEIRSNLTPALFRRVTKPAVDSKAWDVAVERGEIPKKVIRACVEVSNSVRVLVRPTKGADKPKATAKPKTSKKATA